MLGVCTSIKPGADNWHSLAVRPERPGHGPVVNARSASKRSDTPTCPTCGSDEPKMRMTTWSGIKGEPLKPCNSPWHVLVPDTEKGET